MRRIKLTCGVLILAALTLVAIDNAIAQDKTGRVKVQMPNVRAMRGYMKISDIKGESTDKDHQDWIDVLSVDWGGSEPGSDRASGSGEVVLVRHFDKASPEILEKIAEGKHIPSIELDAPAERVGAAQPHARYRLEKVRITSYSIDASGDRPVETITLNYGKVEAKSDVILKGKKVLEN